MQKKWVLVAGGVAAVALLLVAGQLLLNRTAPTRDAAQPPGTPASATSSTAAGSPAKAPGTSTASGTASTRPPGYIAPLPGGKPLKPVSPTSVAKGGSALHPLSSAPAGLIAGFSAGKLPTGSTYAVTFRPWGYGPASHTGQTVVVTLTTIEPVGGAPDLRSLTRPPMLLVMSAAEGGEVLAGGLHTGTVTFVADGAQLVPTLSKVVAPAE
jgi:hypothetical protein